MKNEEWPCGGHSWEEGRSRKLYLRGGRNEYFAYEEENAGNCAYEEEGMNTALIRKRTQETALMRKKK